MYFLLIDFTKKKIHHPQTIARADKTKQKKNTNTNTNTNTNKKEKPNTKKYISIYFSFCVFPSLLISNKKNTHTDTYKHKMSSNNFAFYNLADLRSDDVDKSQRAIYNTRFGDYNVTNYYPDPAAGAHVQFATSQPDVAWFSVYQGSSVGGSVIDVDSSLSLGMQQGRSLEKLSLSQRPFLTVPYLGRGACDVVMEAQLIQGERGQDQKKSVNTIMSQSFMDYTMYPVDNKMQENTTNPKYKIEESAMEGWIRGGILTREMMNDRAFIQQNRPNVSF